jgi:ankyrin repeat protein
MRLALVLLLILAPAVDLTTEEGKRHWTNLGGSKVSRGGQPLWLHNLPEIDALLQEGTDINARGNSGETIAMAAARSGNLELLKALVERGAKLDARDDGGDTLLHVAARNGALPVMAYLIEKGADVSAQDGSGRTAAQAAEQMKQLEAVELLVKFGAKAGVAAMSPIEWKRAVRSGEWDKLDAGIAAGFAVDVELAKQPIWWMGDEKARAREGAARPIDLARYEAVLARLVKLSAPGKPQLDELLLLAIDKSDPVGVRVLVAAGANPDARTSWGSSALASAARKGDADTLKELLSQKATLEAAGTDGRTALFEAVIHGQLDSVRVLLEAGADPLRKDSMGLTASQLARQQGKPEILSMIATKTGDTGAQDAARVRALIEAACQDDPAALEKAMRDQKDLDALDDQKRSALVAAIQYRKPEHAKRLLDAGADPNRAEGACDRPAPQLQPQPVPKSPVPRRGRGPAQEMNVLDAADADVATRMSGRSAGFIDPTYDSCRTPLIVAIEVDHAGLVKLLLARGAKAGAEVGGTKRTALEAAARIGNPAVVRMLLEAGASPNHTDALGRTALEEARKNGNTKAARLIEARR